MPARNRVAEVNAALKARGVRERLARGHGYYYFHSGEASGWPSSSVYVYRSDDLPLERWLEEYDRLKAAADRWNGGAIPRRTARRSS